MVSSPVTSDWLEALFEQPPDQQTYFLQSANLLSMEGLSKVLDETMRLARKDPGKARQLTLICTNAARQADLPRLLPRATYVRAQTHAVRGEFSAALELIHTARSEWEAIGERLEALRTNLGLMHVLNELGRHQEALEAGQAILDAFSGGSETPLQATIMIAIAYSNLGVCYETMGRYEEALEAYGIAEARLTELEMIEYIGDVSNNRGIVLMYLGRVSEALSDFEKALQITEDAGLTLLQAQVLNNIGEAHLIQGTYTQSLKAFEQARQLFENLDAQANQGILLHEMADAYKALNLYPEALALYQEAVEMTKQAGMADHNARALLGMGATLIAQRRFGEAGPVLDDAASLFEEAGHLPLLSSVLLEQSELQWESGEREAALQTGQRALNLVRGENWPVQRIYANLHMADLLFPDAQAAEGYLLEARRLAQRLNLPVINHHLNSRLGHLYLLKGRDMEAQSYLEAAISEIERLRGNLAHEVGRSFFLQDKTSPYEYLLQLHLMRGDPQSVKQAFVVSEAAKSRALVDLLAGVVKPEKIPTEAVGLADRLNALQKDLSAAYNRFLEPTEQWNESSLKELHVRVSKLEGEISQLRLRAASYASEPDPFGIPFSLESLLVQLPTNHTLIAYHISGDEILAFIVRKAEVTVVRQVSLASVVQNLLIRLNAQWDRFRVGRDFPLRHMSLLLKSTQRILASLYRELIEPLHNQLRKWALEDNDSIESLVIVPHGILHQVPFHALYDGRQYILDEFEISYALSSAVYALCQGRQRPGYRRALVMGYADALIPEVDLETQIVAGALRSKGVQTELLTGDEARQGTFLEAATGCDVLHLACHGMFRADNPMFSALKFADGWLTAADLLQLRLESTLIALSACESGRGYVLLGDEVIGPPRALLGAGASSVLVSLWVVPDRTTAAFMSNWYELLLSGLGPASALRRAQQALRERYPHPYYWAPYILIGQN